MGKPNSRSAVFLDRVYIEQQIAALRTDILMALDAKAKEIRAREDKIISILEGGQLTTKQPTMVPAEKPNIEPVEHAWKLEMRRRVDKLVKDYPELYADFNAVLRRVYTKMRNTYGFVSDQVIKEYRYAHPNIDKTTVLDAVTDDPQWRSIFEPILFNLEEESRKEMERRRMVEEVEMGRTRQELIQPLIEARGDKTNFGCATYVVVKARLKKKGIRYEDYEDKYRKEKGIKRKLSNGELIDNIPSLKKEFAKAVGELLAEQKVVK